MCGRMECACQVWLCLGPYLKPADVNRRLFGHGPLPVRTSRFAVCVQCFLWVALMINYTIYIIHLYNEFVGSPYSVSFEN